MLRGTFDLVSGYKAYHVPASVLAESPLPVARLRAEGKILSDKQWLLRIIVLESFAGVPGMVGGTLRHLRSLRLLVSYSVTPSFDYGLRRYCSADDVEERWGMDTYVIGGGGE
jgi:hypothetical protein